MDFDDMLGYALTVLKRYPPILQQYRQRYRYLCVDEAQDTSRLQYAVIDLLVQQEQNLFLVGDEDQSIYRFRGACPENLLAFPSLYPQAKVLKMEENFRSTVEIVSCAQRFIEGNRQRYQKKMFTNNAQGEPVEVKPLHDFFRPVPRSHRRLSCRGGDHRLYLPQQPVGGADGGHPRPQRCGFLHKRTQDPLKEQLCGDRCAGVLFAEL